MTSVNEVPQNPTPDTLALNAYTTGAQALIQQMRDMRQQVPKFVIPASDSDGRKLANAANLPPVFVELTAVAVTNSAPLVRNGATDPVQTRDLMAYANAYEPFADELEALAKFVRHSIALAKGKAGNDALITYSLAKRLAKLPETADLKPHVEDMTRALGKRGRKAKAQPAPAPVPSTPTPTPSKTD